MKNKVALFPGTFDPFTTGHYALVRRALQIADEIVIAIGTNSSKTNCFTLGERMEAIRKIYAGEPRIRVMSYDTLTGDLAKEINADFILRGVRNIYDYEYEKNIADINRKISNIETVIMFSEPEYEHTSSSLVRELMKYNKDVSNLIPATK